MYGVMVHIRDGQNAAGQLLYALQWFALVLKLHIIASLLYITNICSLRFLSTGHLHVFALVFVFVNSACD